MKKKKSLLLFLAATSANFVQAAPPHFKLVLRLVLKMCKKKVIPL